MNNVQPIKISVIVTTYNWPAALEAVLTALIAQKTSYPFEIIVADDGSADDTAILIRHFKNQFSIPILHIWQPDDGFRAAAIRNKATIAAEGDYIIFIDGDCIPSESFIERHAALAEPKNFVAGNRILLNQAFTQKVLSQRLPLHQWPVWRWAIAWLYRRCNRFSPFFLLPLGRTIGLGASQRWQGAKGCNLAVWKTDLLQVNGWEEKFIGWGHEDADLVIRLLHAGIQRKSGRFQVPVIHLWHAENDRRHEQENWALFQARAHTIENSAEKGLSQYDL